MFDTTTCQSTSRSTVPRTNEPPATPVLPVLREHHYTYCIPVTLGRNVWVGANVSILPGVTIGDNCVIGAGSVATHSVPANSVAYGAPCEVAREIGDKDRECFYKDRKFDVWE